MPHLIIEHTKNISDSIDMKELVTACHDALVGEGVDKARLKTRAIEISHSVVGTNEVNQGAMAHITLLLLEGREVTVKQQYGQAVHKVAKAKIQEKFPDCAVTLEVRDMVTDNYIL